MDCTAAFLFTVFFYSAHASQSISVRMCICGFSAGNLTRSPGVLKTLRSSRTDEALVLLLSHPQRDVAAGKRPKLTFQYGRLVAVTVMTSFSYRDMTHK